MGKAGGDSPSPEKDTILHISLPKGKKGRWPQIRLDFALAESIARKDLEKLIGELPFTQTSVFGRFGRPLLTPLQGMLEIHPYAAKLRESEIPILHCRATSLSGAITRVCEIKPRALGMVIYADAAASTRIVASLVVDVRPFANSRNFDILRAETSDSNWGGGPILHPRRLSTA